MIAWILLGGLWAGLIALWIAHFRMLRSKPEPIDPELIERAQKAIEDYESWRGQREKPWLS